MNEVSADNSTPTKPVKRPARDLTGQVFGRLTVVTFVRPAPRKLKWICECECGQIKHVASDALLRGRQLSCGCLMRELVRARATTHGLAARHKRHSDYGVWLHMRDRCNNPRFEDYKNYGGRGITVCERWNDFTAFLADMGPRPSPKHSIDRICNDGNYEPGNCRWATKIEQVNNTRQNHIVEFDGRTMNITQWSADTGLASWVITKRLKLGWTPTDALTKPVNKNYARH